MEMESNIDRQKRIARNTMLLYCRMLLLMFVGLYTSRVVLGALGIDDYGIYNAVGGVVSIFSVISAALTSAISRFLTFELGRKDGSQARLRAIFRNSMKIQLMMVAAIIVLAETIGLWYLNSKMFIPDGRLTAANWVFQFSLLTFSINLVSIPFNAAIIAHEKMTAFAYIGIFEGLAKLAVAFLLLAAPLDRLIFYAFLMCAVALLVRLTYGIYCRRNFEECRKGETQDAESTGAQLRQMLSFAGWNFIGASSAVLRDHGGNLLINFFCGTAVNAAKGVTMQLSSTVQAFVSNFMTALNPQITKSYASQDKDYVETLVFKGARLSFFLLLVLSLPLMLNMDFVLGVWLKNVPPRAASFAILTLIFAMSESLSNPLITLQLATGNIKKYQIIVGGLQLLNVPISWILLAHDFAPECVLVVAIVLSQICLFARLILLKDMAGLDPFSYLGKVYLRVIITCGFCLLVPFLLQSRLPGGWGGFLASSAICVASCCTWIWFKGLENDEKDMIIEKFRRK